MLDNSLEALATSNERYRRNYIDLLKYLDSIGLKEDILNKIREKLNDEGDKNKE